MSLEEDAERLRLLGACPSTKCSSGQRRVARTITYVRIKGLAEFGSKDKVGYDGNLERAAAAKLVVRKVVEGCGSTVDTIRSSTNREMYFHGSTGRC